MDRSHHFFITIHRYKVPGLANVLKLDTANDEGWWKRNKRKESCILN
jgi:hypothetical protein